MRGVTESGCGTMRRSHFSSLGAVTTGGQKCERVTKSGWGGRRGRKEAREAGGEEGGTAALKQEESFMLKT